MRSELTIAALVGATVLLIAAVGLNPAYADKFVNNNQGNTNSATGGSGGSGTGGTGGSAEANPTVSPTINPTISPSINQNPTINIGDTKEKEKENNKP